MDESFLISCFYDEEEFPGKEFPAAAFTYPAVHLCQPAVQKAVCVGAVAIVAAGQSPGTRYKDPDTVDSIFHRISILIHGLYCQESQILPARDQNRRRCGEQQTSGIFKGRSAGGA